MQFSLICVLCALSFTTLEAKTSLLEESPLSLPTQKIANESFLEDVSILSEEFETLEEESAFFGNTAPLEEVNPTIFAHDSKGEAPFIDLSKALDDVEMPISLKIVEERVPVVVESSDEKAAVEPLFVQMEEGQAASAVFKQTQDFSVIDAPSLVNDNAPITSSHVIEDPSSPIDIQSSSTEIKPNLDIEVDLTRAFAGAPLIYSLLISMSIFSVFIWLYTTLSLKKMSTIPTLFLNGINSHLSGNNFEEALSLCRNENTLLSKMVSSGIQSRRHGLAAMIESMKAEGRRSSMNFWQKIGLLNDVAILAPMLGLLGTVLGMFYAFYDVNRSIESITTLFDGLGISIGTTVAGLMVAILALILHSTAKYRLVKVLAQVESEAHSVASLIDNHASLYSSGPR